MVTRKHASWQFLPDELISLSFCPSRQTICLLLSSDKRDPSLALTWLPCLPASPLLHADLKAWHVGQKPQPQPALPLPLSPGPGGGSAAAALLPLEEPEAGHRPWALVPWKHARIKSPGTLRPERTLTHVGVCGILSELEPRPWLSRLHPKETPERLP